MAIEMTRHQIGRIEALGRSLDDAATVEDGTVSGALEAGLYRIRALTPSRIRIGTDLDDATGGEGWPESHIEVRAISEGEVIAVDELA